MWELVFRNGARMLLGSTAMGAGGVTYAAHSDEGFNRSLYFWRKAFPIYLHYRAAQLYMEHAQLSDEEQDAEYEKLHEKYAPEVFDIVLELKGFYVKLAQTGSTRPDVLPKQYLERAAKLQDDAPSKPVEEICAIIEQSYGKPMDQVFQSIDTKPLGAASIGQAHRAVLLDGQEVAVKVQHPDAETFFRWDIKTIQDFCRYFQPAHLPYLVEVEKQFMTEFNYVEEAKNLDTVRKNIAKSPYAAKVAIPEPRMELCTKEVLVMEFLKGRKLLDGIQDHFEAIAADKGVTDKEREAKGLDIEVGPSSLQLRLYGLTLGAKHLTRRIGRASYDYTLGFVAPKKWTLREDEQHQLLNLPEILKLIMDVHGYEIFVDGSFNGDPHPGNILLLEDGRLGLIDYGQVKHISKEHRIHLAKLIVALAGGSRDDIINVLTKDMRVRTTKMDPYFLEKQARLMIDNDDRTVTEGMNAQLFLEHLHTYSWNWLALSQKNGESSSSSSGHSNSVQSQRNAVKSKRPLLLNRPPTNTQPEHPKPKTISTATDREKAVKINTEAVEAFSRLRIADRTISAEALRQEMEGRKFIKLQQMDRVPKDTFTNGEVDWVTIGVLTRKTLSKPAANGSTFMLGVFLFGDAYANHWKELTGSIVAVLNAALLPATEKNKFAFKATQPTELVKLGKAVDFGICKGMTSGEARCRLAVNTAKPKNLSAGVYTSALSTSSSSGWNPIITKKRKRNDAAGGVLGVPTVLSASGAVVQRGRARFAAAGALSERRRGTMSLMDQLREPAASMNSVVRSSATVTHPSSRAQKIVSAVLAGDGKPLKRSKTKKVDMMQFMNTGSQVKK
ncbi:Protein kinase-like domain [Phytophthora cactorum]|nr:Protein kinase-like domain [Phytophthora cactorum]